MMHLTQHKLHNGIVMENEIFSYGNPQVGVENPEIYRKNYGFALWNAGYDGAMDFAYQYQVWSKYLERL